MNILFCDGGSCRKAGSEPVIREARAYLRNNGLWDKTHTIKTRCNGRCEDAPTCIVQKGNYWYKKLTANTIIPVLKSHLIHNKPIEDHLIYQDGWESLLSDDERPEITPKPFQYKIDDQLERCMLTKGFSSDQYLYPLFLFLKTVNENISLVLANGERYFFSELQDIEYTSTYTVTLHFKDNRVIHLIIGSVSKEEPLEAIQKKITSTEYFILEETNLRGIRFKDKLTRLCGMVYIPETATKTWEYCLNIQLKGATVNEKEYFNA
ncbi:(2Fe-2S) ferredoxin domain-containing protein [uncultured Aquimarina sp.]|uniref:(2Fe-2S) ferredoxin domain-containing protein n=1 Tax=uncultured Aquimarina sp. TaxID=575652 RepID=UPI0026169ED0|nr:(2Fe-2S) ferredoxin domain-containing protein [uncultured Aquimarina sp.]